MYFYTFDNAELSVFFIDRKIAGPCVNWENSNVEHNVNVKNQQRKTKNKKCHEDVLIAFSEFFFLFDQTDRKRWQIAKFDYQ